MAKTYMLSEMPTQISISVKNMTNELIEEALEQLRLVAEQATQEIKSTPIRSNRNSSHLMDDFIAKQKGFGSNTHYIIYSPNHWQRVHLIELGWHHYKMKDGQNFIPGRRFMYKAYDRAMKELKINIGEIIKDKTNN